MLFYTGLILIFYAPNAGRAFDTLTSVFENGASIFPPTLVT